MDVYCKHEWIKNEQEVRTGFRVLVNEVGALCSRCGATWDRITREPEKIIGYTK